MRTLKLLSMLCLLWTVGIVANADEIPNDEIWYEASEKLTETTNGSDGLHTNAFNTSISLHTFSNGKGIIKFNGNVNSIGDHAFSVCKGLTSITIPNSMKSIGDYAFWACSNLTSITIPNSVTNIGKCAFYGCSSLTSITIPNSVTSIGDQAFTSCSSLTSITIPNSVTSIGEYAFESCSGLTSIIIPNSVTSMGLNPFSNCTGLESIIVSKDNPYFSDYGSNIIVSTLTHELITGCRNSTIPNSVTSIGHLAFYHCSGLTSIIIPNSVTSIGDDAFNGCSGLTSITIPNSVTSIGECAFNGCSGLTSITIPNSLTSIGECAFSDCSGLTSIEVDSFNSKYDSRDNCNAIIETSTNTLITGCKNTIIPISVTSIGACAFESCSGLTSIIIPNSVTSIGGSAFRYCSGLKSVTIGNSVTSIGNYAYSDCSSLISMYVSWDEPLVVDESMLSGSSINSATLYVPTGTKALYEAANVWKDFGTIVEFSPNITFADANVKALCIANWDTNDDGELSESEASSVTNLGYVFKNNKNITSFDELQYFTGIKSIEFYAFQDCSGLTSITIPNSVTSIGNWVFSGCKGLTSITIPNSVMSIGKFAFEWCSGLTSITIPNSVTSIGDYAFQDCSGLTSITIPNSVTSIGEMAFASCSGLTSISIPNSVTSIGDWAFKSCSSLTSITIPNSVTSIGSCAFHGCSGLTSITIPNSVTSIGSGAFYNCSGLTSITIPNSVTSIGNYAFSSCSGLTSITIPNSVTSIGDGAFGGCSSLTSITIPNSVKSIGDYAFSNCSGLTSMYVFWDEPLVASGGMLSGSSINSATLYVPTGTKALYEAAPVWKDFGTITIRSEEPYNFFAIDKNGSEIKEEVKSDDDVEIQDSYVDLLITENVEDVNITYTRSFSSSGNWQAWFVPFDVNYNDMSKDYEVAQIQGVLTDENGSPYIAFCKVKSGVIKANTPYVVKPKLSGEIQTKTTSKLHTTDDAKPFTIQSVANTFTFGGVYEKTTIGNKGWYALNTKGSFQKMGESLYLKSFRLYMSIAERADNPYSASVASDEVKMIVLGDEDATSINEVESLISTGKMYTLQGLETNVIRRGEIYIINGKKYLGK